MTPPPRAPAPPAGTPRPARRRAAPPALPVPGARVVSVLPDVAGLDRTFDYLVPDDLADGVRLGTVVRADLGGRRVAGWVVADGVEAPPGLALRPLTRVTGWGPTPDVVDLAGWAAWRWAGRRSALLATASAPGAVRHLPPARRGAPRPPADPGELAGLVDEAVAAPVSVLRLPPAGDPTTLVALVAQRGPTLVVVPSLPRAAILAGRLRRAGAGVAEVPAHWAQARAGAGVVIGARSAVWAPVPGLAAVVVLDAHDEGLVQEQAPTWWAATVAAERARRAGVPCIWVSPCPTLELTGVAAVLRPSVGAERRGWAPLEIVDRRHDDPAVGLYSAPLVTALRRAGRAVCVLNRTGRARLLVCAACDETARCETCGAAVVAAPGTDAPHPLVCGRCATVRPPVCALCHSTRLKHLRPGVSRVRDDLATLLGVDVGEVTAATPELPGTAVVVGTEAVLHRVTDADLVAFIEFDQELLAPRFRAGEEALALLARASRVVGGRRRGGRVLVQTRSPDHEVLAAAVGADPSALGVTEAAQRRDLGLPPARALAAVSGPAAADLVAALPADAGIEVVDPGDGRWLVRAADHDTLCTALAATPRPAGRVRVEVDPLRI